MRQVNKFERRGIGDRSREGKELSEAIDGERNEDMMRRKIDVQGTEREEGRR